MPISFSLAAHAVGYSFPTGDRLFSDLTFTISNGRYALVGPNGVGKTTLARILAGVLAPTEGEVRSSHPVVYVPQFQDRPPVSVDEYLAVIWDDPFLNRELSRRLLGGIGVDKPLGVLSGGEWARVRLLKALSLSQGLLILDEPTNNLDRESRESIYAFLRALDRPVLIVSHDRELLEIVDTTLELSNRGLTVFGGNYAFYAEERKNERDRQDVELDRLRREKKKTEREREKKLQRQEKRSRRGEREADRGGIPRIMIGGLRQNAELTHAKIARDEDGRVDEARKKFSEFYARTKLETTLRIDLPETHLAAGKLVFEIENFNFRFAGSEAPLWKEPVNLVMRGPQRWSIGGANGSGKSTLLHLLTGARPIAGERTGSLRLQPLPFAYLDQEFAILDVDATVMENVRASSLLDEVEVRNRLAMFQLTKDRVHQKAATLSGGERFKAALAKVLLASPAPRLLVLDEPTNNLDISSVEVLEDALRSYEGALLVISHDRVFLENIGAVRVLEL